MTAGHIYVFFVTIHLTRLMLFTEREYDITMRVKFAINDLLLACTTFYACNTSTGGRRGDGGAMVDE